MEDFKFDSIKEALKDFAAGKPLIVADDEDRENEGDLICSGQMVTPEIIKFMAEEAKGLVSANGRTKYRWLENCLYRKY